ncbi:unnamed protein product [Cunninghamella blakesleeana]
MPEIAEVEYARKQCHTYCLSRKVTKVEVVEDELVFSNMKANSFAKYLKGKTILDTKRWGKYFILLLDGDRHIVGHMGMTGNLKFKHELKENETWPPRFWKTIITFEKSNNDKEKTKKDEKEEPMIMAFCDARRLGRIRLVEGDPLKSEPISKLGFDPLLNLPDETEFTKLIEKRAMPIKALLLDQAFSAGVGNWIADEILYHSRIHPAQYTNTLTKKECQMLREQMLRVCQIAVDAESDESLFPDDWLMTYRWNKGKGKGKGVLPSGHKLAFETVGGRTSAYVPALQKLRGKGPIKKSKKRVKSDDDSDDDDNEKQVNIKKDTIVKKKTKTIKSKTKSTTNNETKEKISVDKTITTLSSSSVSSRSLRYRKRNTVEKE